MVPMDELNGFAWRQPEPHRKTRTKNLDTMAAVLRQEGTLRERPIRRQGYSCCRDEMEG